MADMTQPEADALAIDLLNRLPDSRLLWVAYCVKQTRDLQNLVTWTVAEASWSTLTPAQKTQWESDLRG